MADEIRLSTVLRFSKNGNLAVFSKGQQTFSSSGTRYLQTIQKVGTTVVPLNVGDTVAAPGPMIPGYLAICNLASKGVVSIRAGAAGADVVSLDPGQVAMFPLGTPDPYLIATEELEVEYLVVEK